MTIPPAKRYKIWEPVLLSLVAILGMVVGARIAAPGQEKTSAAVTRLDYSGRQVEEIIRFLESRYVDEVSCDKLVTRAIEAILDSLDPHTHYFPPEARGVLEEQTAGIYAGIGAEIGFIRDSMVILSLRAESPGKKAGLHAGDIVVGIDGHRLYTDSLRPDSLIAKVRGPEGTRIRLDIKPMLLDSVYSVEMTRKKIQVPSIAAATMLDTAVAYIKVLRFSQHTYREFMDAWEHLYTEENARHLILDLRDNPGGFLTEAVNMLSQMIEEKGLTLVYTKGKDGFRQDFKSTGKIFFPIGRIAVLINENSASASEIIAGCLQDLDRGVILGERSFGKGLVQEQFDLSNGGTLRMTVSRYFTPSGRLIQKPYDALSGGDTTTFFLTRHGRRVLAGGGIMPDFSVAPAIDWEDPIAKAWMEVLTEYALREILRKKDSPGSSDSLGLESLRKRLPPVNQRLIDIRALALRQNSRRTATMMTFFDAHAEVLGDIAGAMIIAFQTGESDWRMLCLENDPVIRKARDAMALDLPALLNFPN